MIRAKQGFILQKMMAGYMIISVGDSTEAFQGIIQTNETGAFYWKMIEKGTTVDELVRASMDRFEELDENIARLDVEEFLKDISMTVDIV